MHPFTESKQNARKLRRKSVIVQLDHPSVAHLFVIMRTNIWADKQLIIEVARGIIVDSPTKYTVIML